MRAQPHQLRCAALALCLLLACAACSAQDAQSKEQTSLAEEAAGVKVPAKGKMTPAARPRGRVAGRAGAAAGAAAGQAPGKVLGKFAAAQGKAPAKAAGKVPGKAAGAAARPKQSVAKKGLTGKDLEAAVQKVLNTYTEQHFTPDLACCFLTIAVFLRIAHHST